MTNSENGWRSEDAEIADLQALHACFPLAGSPSKGLFSADPALLEYLLSVLRHSPTSPPARSVDEWRVFLSLLDEHGVRPAATFHLLKQPAHLRPPDENFDWLRRELFRSAAVVMKEDQLSATLLERLREQGIAPLLLKGAALSRSLYSDAVMRPGSDIEILANDDESKGCSDTIITMAYSILYDLHSLPYSSVRYT